jgi:hypothetical protein
MDATGWLDGLRWLMAGVVTNLRRGPDDPYDPADDPPYTWKADE